MRSALSKSLIPASSLWSNKRFKSIRTSRFPANLDNSDVFLNGSIVLIARSAGKNSVHCSSVSNALSKSLTPSSVWSSKDFNTIRPLYFPSNHNNGEVFLSGSSCFIAKSAFINPGSFSNALSNTLIPSSV